MEIVATELQIVKHEAARGLGTFWRMIMLCLAEEACSSFLLARCV